MKVRDGRSNGLHLRRKMHERAAGRNGRAGVSAHRFASKTIGGPERTPPIVSMDTSENQEEGKFSGDGVFVLFGSCAPP
jgi:hypothetical protein